MSDTQKRDAVLEEFAHDAGAHRVWGVAGMADEILRLRAENAALTAAVERVRALHASERRHNGWIDVTCCRECSDDNNTYRYPCSTLHALEGTP